MVLRNCLSTLPTHNRPHRGAGRGCTIPQMPRRLQITCVVLECTRRIMGLSGFLGVHIQKKVKLHCKELSSHFHFQNLVMAWRKPGKPHSSYFCLPPPCGPRTAGPHRRGNFPNNHKCSAMKCSAQQSRQAPALSLET